MSENNFEDIISKITSNPELISKISSGVKEENGDMGKALSNVIGILTDSDVLNNKNDSDENDSEKEKNSDTSKDIFKNIDNKSGIDALIFSFCSTISRNAPLLLALKPYLGKEKRDMIDSIVKLSQLASIVNLAK